MNFIGLNKLNFFSVFNDYFLGLMLIYLFFVFILLCYNIYGITFQNSICFIFSYLFFLSIFFLFEELPLNFFFNNYQTLKTNYIGFFKSITLDLLAIFSKILVILFSIIFLLIISNLLNEYKISFFEYLFLLLFSIFGLIFLCFTNNLLITFLSIELISISSYFLAGFKKFSTYSLESGLKYLVIGAISSSFFLLGSCFIYAYSGSINLTDLYYLTSNLNKILLLNNFNYFNPTINLIFFSNSFFIETGIILILLSLFIKLALAPFYSWSIDVYEGSPSMSTFYFSVISKLSFFIFFYRFCFITFYYYFNDYFLFYYLVIGFISVVIGSFGGLRQKKIKSLLAFSSVSHIGYSLLALTSFSKFGFEMFFFYFISYILASIIVWQIILNLKKIDRYDQKNSKDIGDLTLLNKSNKFLSIALCLSFFSFAGIPPLLGFLAKFGVFLNLLLEKFYLISVLLILCSMVSAFYYLRIIKILYFENFIIGKLYSLNSKNIFLICFFVFLLIFIFVKPTVFYLHKSLLIGSFNF